MKTAVVVDCVRTPIGRAHKDRGLFRDVRSDDLAVACVKALVQRTGIHPAEIEDILLGNTQQTLEQGLNVARSIGLMAGLPIEAGGATINRLCGSSLQALHQAAHAIMAGFEDVHIVGGGLYDAVNEGIRQGYTQGFLRGSIAVQPFSARVNGHSHVTKGRAPCCCPEFLLHSVLASATFQPIPAGRPCDALPCPSG